MASHSMRVSTHTTKVTEFTLSTEPYPTNHAEMEKALVAARHQFKDVFGNWPADDQIKIRVSDYDIVIYFVEDLPEPPPTLHLAKGSSAQAADTFGLKLH